LLEVVSILRMHVNILIYINCTLKKVTTLFMKLWLDIYLLFRALVSFYIKNLICSLIY